MRIKSIIGAACAYLAVASFNASAATVLSIEWEVVALINQGQLEPLADSKDAYSYLITNLLPTGLTGVMAAALLASKSFLISRSGSVSNS